ncbi:MAG: hypothetical protein R3321_01620 [Nitrososphaeraceae archaeon]|nr:hypothetical protein [Nitrososphaeraceae archaeon]
MRETVAHICELIRDIFHIQSQPIPVTIESTSKNHKSNFFQFMVFWSVSVLVIANITMMLDLSFWSKSNKIVLDDSIEDRLHTFIKPRSIYNLSIIETSDNLNKVIWSYNQQHLYSKYHIAQDEVHHIDPIVLTFKEEGFCYNSALNSIYCPIDEHYLMLIDYEEKLAQSEILFIYLNIKGILNES